MQFTIVSVIAALAATAIAVPVPGENHHPTAKANFIGAADASFTQDFKTDGTYTAISTFPPFSSPYAHLDMISVS